MQTGASIQPIETDCQGEAKVLKGFLQLRHRLDGASFDLTWHHNDGFWILQHGNPFTGPSEIIESKPNQYKVYTTESGLQKLDSRPCTLPFDTDSREAIGKIAMPFEPSEDTRFTLGADFLTVPRLKTQQDIISRFCDLSKSAGALLPLAIKNDLVGYVQEWANKYMAEWWFALLFKLNGETVAFKNGGKFQYRQEVTIYDPILRSISAIEMIFGIKPHQVSKTKPNRARNGTQANRTCDAKQARNKGKFTVKEELIVSALLKHHNYESPIGGVRASVTRTEPASYRKLMELSKVQSKATVSKFFRKWFPDEKKPSKKYKIICLDASRLADQLARLVPGDVPSNYQLNVDPGE